jgi:hypothetical protein
MKDASARVEMICLVCSMIFNGAVFALSITDSTERAIPAENLRIMSNGRFIAYKGPDLYEREGFGWQVVSTVNLVLAAGVLGGFSHRGTPRPKKGADIKGTGVVYP